MVKITQLSVMLSQAHSLTRLMRSPLSLPRRTARQVLTSHSQSPITQAAYDSVTADGGDLDAFLAAIEDADTQEIEITVDFVRDDDAWLVDDEDGENIQKVYAFYIDALDYSFALLIFSSTLIRRGRVVLFR